jgi:hypothetical protein
MFLNIYLFILIVLFGNAARLFTRTAADLLRGGGESRVRFLAFPCLICGGEIGNGTDFPLSTSAFPCQYHSTAVPYSFIHHRSCTTLATDNVFK